MSRYSDATDLISGGLGVVIGVFARRRFGPSSDSDIAPLAMRRAYLLGVTTLYVVVLLAILWSPYDFSLVDSQSIRARWHLFFGLPFARALEGSYVAALNGFVQKFTLFLPLGGLVAALAAVFPPAWRTTAAVGLFGLVSSLAVAIELGQILLPGRFASFDDALICIAGSLAGYWLMRRLQRP